MKIVILGVGAVGSTLANLLSQEDNDVIVVDQDPQPLKKLEEDADIRTVVGEHLILIYWSMLILKMLTW